MDYKLKNDSFMNIDAVEVEEVERDDMADETLSEFVETFTIKVYADNPHTSQEIVADSVVLQEKEESLIKDLIDGKITFKEYNSQMGRNVDDIEQDDGDVFENKLDKESLYLPTFKPLKDRETKVRMRPRRRCVLDPTLQGLMGEANLSYARGQIELAEKVCLEIIRQVPLAHEPFLTLAQIYESKDPEKCLQFSLIAAHLNIADIDQWIRVADLCIEIGDMHKAINCYSRAIKAHPKNLDIRLRKINLLEKIGEHKLVFRSYFSLLPIIPVEMADFLLTTAKMLAARLHKEENFSKALEAMSCAYKKVPDLFQTEDIHLLLELHLINHCYLSIIEILCNCTNLDVTLEVKEGITCVTAYKIPDNMELDFRIKLICAFIHLQAFHLLEDLLGDVLNRIDIDTDGDCYLDISEALIKEKKHTEALRLLLPLVNSTKFSLAAVWLLVGECWRAVFENDKAILAYKMVVSLAPQHFDTRLTLSSLLKLRGDHKEALQVLEQNFQNEQLDPCLLYERCFMLKETQNLEQYLITGYWLISRHCIRLRNRYEMGAVACFGRFTSRISQIKEIRVARFEEIGDFDMPEFLENAADPPLEDEWKLFKNLVTTAFNLQNYNIMQKLTFTALSSKKFSPFLKEIEFMAMLSCIYNRDSYFAYNFVREFVLKEMSNIRAWNLLNVVVQISDDVRYSKFIFRLLERQEVHPFLVTMRANYFLIAGTYKYALNDYMTAYKNTSLSILPLLIAITYAQMACQKFVAKKNVLVIQAIGFMKTYEGSREVECGQEIHYNLGRLHHQLGILHIAVYHYQQALLFNCNLKTANLAFLDLSKEAAFNLHVIYKRCGNLQLARKYLYDYIII